MAFTSIILFAAAFLTLSHSEDEEPQAPPEQPETITTASGLQITTLLKPEECTAKAEKGHKVSVCLSLFNFLRISLGFI